MTLALTCALCLAGGQPGVGLRAPDTTPSTFAFELQTPFSPSSPTVSLDLAGGHDAIAWYQHDHGGPQSQDGSDHGGHSWMGTTMIVVMVAMMVVAGGILMMRGGRAAAWSPAAGPAALAIPVTGPRLSRSGG